MRGKGYKEGNRGTDIRKGMVEEGYKEGDGGGRI
jgi:hypothetical protein